MWRFYINSNPITSVKANNIDRLDKWVATRSLQLSNEIIILRCSLLNILNIKLKSTKVIKLFNSNEKREKLIHVIYKYIHEKYGWRI